MSIGAPEIILILFVVALSSIVWVIPFWFVFKKAGFVPPLSLLMLFPLINIVMLFYLAFAEWPALRNRTTNGGATQS